EYPSIELVPTYKVNSEDDIKKYHSQFISEGYEGTIIRHSEEGYAINKRSSQLLKYKDFIDIDLVIKDVIPMDKTPEQGTCIFDWKGAKGHPLGDDILGCGMKFSHLERAEILKNKQNY